jgi:hypothetical protein
LKAAFLLHFTQLVDWPDAAFGGEASPLVICTLGDDVFRGDLDAIVRGKAAGSRPLNVLHLTAAQPVQGCHVLFVAAGERTRVSLLVARLNEAPVLLVGETDDFIEKGGSIGFVVEANKVRFNINLIAARRAGLKVSSRLLLLARSVKGGRL